MDTEELKKEIEELKQEVETLKEFVASMQNPSQVDPNVISALQSRGL